MPAPARIVSAACASGLSPSAIAAAMPACAQRLDAPSPNRAADTTVTGRGASLSAVNRPARPAPTTTTPLVPNGVFGGNWLCSDIEGYAGTWTALSVVEVDHALDGRASPIGDGGIDRDLLFEEHEAVENLRQRDALHVRAKIAGPHELDPGRLDRDVIAHRAFSDEQ